MRPLLEAIANVRAANHGMVACWQMVARRDPGWVNTDDPALREKLDYIAAELVKYQMDDGYLRTYVR